MNPTLLRTAGEAADRLAITVHEATRDLDTPCGRRLRRAAAGVVVMVDGAVRRATADRRRRFLAAAGRACRRLGRATAGAQLRNRLVPDEALRVLEMQTLVGLALAAVDVELDRSPSLAPPEPEIDRLEETMAA